MAMILDGEALPEQIGAFLMLLRMKEETGAEIAGFARAVRARLPAPAAAPPDLDWPCYAGKARRPPWHLLAALRLAGAGYRVALHGLDGHTPGRLYAGETLARLGLAPARDFAQAQAQLGERGFAYLSLDRLSTPLARLMRLKPVLGLRSAVNTLARCPTRSAPRPRCRPLSIPATCRFIATRRWLWATRASGAFAATAARTSGGRRSRARSPRPRTASRAISRCRR